MEIKGVITQISTNHQILLKRGNNVHVVPATNYKVAMSPDLLKTVRAAGTTTMTTERQTLAEITVTEAGTYFVIGSAVVRPHAIDAYGLLSLHKNDATPNGEVLSNFRIGGGNVTNTVSIASMVTVAANDKIKFKANNKNGVIDIYSGPEGVTSLVAVKLI
ncbi:hypothetical protein [Vibrio phage VP-1]|uniref:Uncharacterized protein n=1 Tax=Vibrio phage VP-1 TaxID=2234088 RepID=A0A4V0NRU6_9CAUD|nr:hypothetical protein [Vibrio phage VP-1]